MYLYTIKYSAVSHNTQNRFDSVYEFVEKFNHIKWSKQKRKEIENMIAIKMNCKMVYILDYSEVKI